MFTSILSALGRPAAIAAAVLLGTATLASAATLQLSTSFDVQAKAQQPNTFGRDTLGLAGSRITIDAIFDDATFTNAFARADSASATVSGSTSGDGTYTITDDFALFSNGQAGLGRPTVFNLGTSTFVNNNAFAIPGVVGAARLGAAGSITRQADGSPVTFALLDALVFNFSGISQFSSTSGYQYNLANFDTTVTDLTVAPVPLPAALPLMLVGLGGFAALRRRRNVAA